MSITAARFSIGTPAKVINGDTIKLDQAVTSNGGASHKIFQETVSLIRWYLILGALL